MKILWAVKEDDEEWEEQIITTDGNRIEVAKAWATQNGFDRFRISEESDTPMPPDFASTVNL